MYVFWGFGTDTGWGAWELWQRWQPDLAASDCPLALLKDEEVEEFDFELAENESRVSFARNLGPVSLHACYFAFRLLREVQVFASRLMWFWEAPSTSEHYNFGHLEKPPRRLHPIEVRFRLSAERFLACTSNFEPLAVWFAQCESGSSEVLRVRSSNLIPCIRSHRALTRKTCQLCHRIWIFLVRLLPWRVLADLCPNVPLPEVCCDLSGICQGVADDMLCINFQWNLLARSCKGHQFCYQARHPKFCALKLWGLLWACLDVQRKQLQNPEEEVPEVPWYWIRIQGLLPNVVLQGCFTDSGTERSYLLWYALMQTLSGSLPEPNVQQNWPCGFISHSDCAVSVQVSKDITTYNQCSCLLILIMYDMYI